MREILFRGFTPDENGKDTAFVNGEWIKGQWVRGSYWKLNKTTYCFKEDYERDPGNTAHYIVFDQMTDWGLPNRHLKADVIPETVGQYTGLTDKNGKKIFEGDILEFSDRYVVVFWHTHLGCWDSNFLKFTNRENGRDDMSPLNWGYKSKVIGNIHDNPELLKGEEENA